MTVNKGNSPDPGRGGGQWYKACPVYARPWLPCAEPQRERKVKTFQAEMSTWNRDQDLTPEVESAQPMEHVLMFVFIVCRVLSTSGLSCDYELALEESILTPTIMERTLSKGRAETVTMVA